MSYEKRRARRRKGAGARAPECAIAAGRWVGQQTWCLVSVLTKREINSIKTGQFILNQGYGLRTKLINICTTSSPGDPQMRWNLNARVPSKQGALAHDASQWEYWYIKSGLFWAALTPFSFPGSFLLFWSRAVRYNQSRKGLRMRMPRARCSKGKVGELAEQKPKGEWFTLLILPVPNAVVKHIWILNSIIQCTEYFPFNLGEDCPAEKKNTHTQPAYFYKLLPPYLFCLSFYSPN